MVYSLNKITQSNNFLKLSVHFQKRGNLEVHNYNEINQCFFVTNSGFYPMNSGYATIMDIQKYNPYKSNIIEKYEEFIYQCKIWIFRFKRKIRLVQ